MNENSQGLELDGRWTGYYQYSSTTFTGMLRQQIHPVSVVFRQSGNKFYGTMEDEITVQEYLYREVIEFASNQFDRETRKSMREFLRRYPKTRLMQILPKQSRIEGSIEAMTVVFTKTYLGIYQSYYDTGEGTIPIADVDDHQVVYTGTLNREGMSIEGTWAIPARDSSGRVGQHEAGGTFKLWKEK